MKLRERGGGKILPPFLVEDAENQTKCKHICLGEYLKMATGEMHPTAVPQNGSAILESRKGCWGAAGSERFPFHPEKPVVKLARHSAQFSSRLLQIRRKPKFKMSKVTMQTHLEGSSIMCLRIKV